MPNVTSLNELKINYISEEDYQTLLKNNLVNSNEIYITPKTTKDDLEGYLTIEEFNYYQDSIYSLINDIYDILTR